MFEKEAGILENTVIKNKYIGGGYKGDNGKEDIEGIRDMAKSQKVKDMQPRTQVKNLEGTLCFGRGESWREDMGIFEGGGI